jgi:protease IV
MSSKPRWTKWDSLIQQTMTQWRSTVNDAQEQAQAVPAQRLVERRIAATLTDQLLADFLKERKAEARWKKTRRYLWVGMLLLSLVYYIAFVLSTFGFKLMPNTDIVAVIKIEGEIAANGSASADKLIPALRKAYERDNVKAIVLAIDSGGGAPVESERIINAMTLFKAAHPKPTYAFISNIGASAAYMIAVHTDRVYAANYSLVGSIGAVMAGWDVHKALDKFEVGQRVFASGEHKTMMSPYKAMSPASEAKAQSLVQALGDRFKAEVLSLRGDRLAKGVNFATGEVWTGDTALQLGLIDEIGTIEAVIAAKHGIKTFDFGPGKPGIPFMSSVFSDLGGGFAQALRAFALEVR